MQAKELVKKFLPRFVLSGYHYGLALVGAILYGFPSRKLTVVGVTGTSGKSTTVDFITRILEEAGNKVASTSSIRFKVAEKEWQNNMKMTMPGRFVIQKILRQAVDAGCRYAVIEVTSEGIKQFRHKFINFDTAVFLNLTPEHIESHGGFENYRNAKIKLFLATSKNHVINTDDENARYFLDTPAQKRVIFGTGAAVQYSDILQNVRVLARNVNRTDFEVDGVKFHLNLLGSFNVYNALAAISVARLYNISLEVCRKALGKITGMPGRLDLVTKDPFWVVVDYAFTPEQLEASYRSLNGRPLVCVLGSCGGGRDKWKRPVLGKIAGKYCKEIIITNEDPYDEDPWEIIQQVETGIEDKERKRHLVLDRKEAIKKAIGLAGAEDTVIITGKGAETRMCLANGKKIPWDDRQIARSFLKK